MVALVLDMTKEQVCNGNEGRPQPELSISRFELKSEAPFKEKGKRLFECSLSVSCVLD